MQARVTIVTFRDIADQTQDLALLVHGNGLILLRGNVEPTDFGFGERADSRKRRAIDALLVREIRDGLKGFLALVKDQDEYPLGAFLYGFRPHDISARDADAMCTSSPSIS